MKFILRTLSLFFTGGTRGIKQRSAKVICGMKCAPPVSLSLFPSCVDDEIPKVFFASLGEREAVSHKLVFSLSRRRATNEIFL
jgi:hypothetical protein